MRVLFVKSSINSNTDAFDIGVGSMAAVLKQNGHEARLFLVRSWSDLSTLYKSVNYWKPDLIAFSMYASSLPSIKKISAHLHTHFPHILQIIGGVHFILNPEEINNFPFVSAACVGEGEYALLKFLRNYSKKDNSHFLTPGFWTRKKKKIIKNTGLPFIHDLEKLPFPDREIFNNQYISHNTYFNNKAALDFIFTRGCPFSCTYCSNFALRNKFQPHTYVRHISPQKAIDWILHDIKKYYCNYIVINDDTFTWNKKWLIEFLHLYKDIKIPFVCNARVGTLTLDVLKKLKAAGCDVVSMGIETGNEKLRTDILNRQMTNQSIIQEFNRAKRLGLKTSAYIMLGLPEETKKEFLETIQLTAKISPTYIALGIFFPYPGTKMYDLCIEKKYLKHKQSLNFIERSDTLLSMPNFSRRDIVYYYNNFSEILKNRKVPNSLFLKIYKLMLFHLLIIPPSSKLYQLTQPLLSVLTFTRRVKYLLFNKNE